MYVDGKPFIRFNDFHLPLSAADVGFLEHMRQNPGKVRRRLPGGTGMNEMLEEHTLEHVVRASDVESAPIRLNTLIMAEPGKTISGDDLYNLFQAAKAEGVTVTSKLHELKGVSIQTFVLPGPGAVQQATRSGRRKGAAMANSERKTARGGSTRNEGNKILPRSQTRTASSRGARQRWRRSPKAGGENSPSRRDPYQPLARRWRVRRGSGKAVHGRRKRAYVMNHLEILRTVRIISVDLDMAVASYETYVPTGEGVGLIDRVNNADFNPAFNCISDALHRNVIMALCRIWDTRADTANLTRLASEFRDPKVIGDLVSIGCKVDASQLKKWPTEIDAVSKSDELSALMRARHRALAHTPSPNVLYKGKARIAEYGDERKVMEKTIPLAEQAGAFIGYSYVMPFEEQRRIRRKHAAKFWDQFGRLT